MGNDPMFLEAARDSIQHKLPINPIVGQALLNHIDALQRALDSIDEDRDEQ